MNTKKLIIAITAFVLPCLVMAQSATDAIFKKYGEQEGFQSVVINGDMMKMMAPSLEKAAANEGSVKEGTIDFSKIKNVKVLNFEAGDVATKAAKLTEFTADVDKAIKDGKYTELMQVNSDGEKVKILGVKDKSTITELVIYRKNLSKEATLIYVDGLFDENTIGSIVSQMNKMK